MFLCSGSSYSWVSFGLSVAMVTTTMRGSAAVEQDDIANSGSPHTRSHVNPIYTWRRRSKWTLHSCASVSAAPSQHLDLLFGFYIPHPLFVSLLAHSFCNIWICILFILPVPLHSLSSPYSAHPSLHFMWQSNVPYCRDSCHTLYLIFSNVRHSALRTEL